MLDFDYTDFDLLNEQKQIKKLLDYFCKKSKEERERKADLLIKEKEIAKNYEIKKKNEIKRAKTLGYKCDGSKEDFEKLGVPKYELEKLEKYADKVERFLYLFSQFVE